MFFNRFSQGLVPDMQLFSSSSAGMSSIPPSCSIHSHSPHSCGLQIRVDKVEKELKRIHPSKAVGPDGINPRVLKVCAEQLSEVVVQMFYVSLSLGEVLVLWKTFSLVPVPKTGICKDLNHFR